MKWSVSWRARVHALASGPVLSGRERRTLLIGGGAIVMLVVGARGVPAWHRWQQRARAESMDWRQQADRATQMAKMLGALRDSLGRRKSRWDHVRPALLGGPAPADASANLTTLVSTTAADANVRLGSIDVHVDSIRSPVTRVWAHAQILGDIAGLMDFLSDLDSGPTLVAVEALSVAPGDVQAPPNRPEQLRVELSMVAIAELPNATGSPVQTAPKQRSPTIPGVAALPTTLFLSDSSLDSLAGVVIDHDPFRLDRRPSDVPYELADNGAAPVLPRPVAPPAKPAVIVAGIVGGPPWAAVLAIADRANVVAHAGDTIIRVPVGIVRTVTRDSVILRWSDTTWRLGIRRSWQ